MWANLFHHSRVRLPRAGPSNCSIRMRRIGRILRISSRAPAPPCTTSPDECFGTGTRDSTGAGSGPRSLTKRSGLVVNGALLGHGAYPKDSAQPKHPHRTSARVAPTGDPATSDAPGAQRAARVSRVVLPDSRNQWPPSQRGYDVEYGFAPLECGEHVSRHIATRRDTHVRPGVQTLHEDG